MSEEKTMNIDKKVLRQEAIKWYRKIKNNKKRSAIDKCEFIKFFFNLTEEDLK